MGRSESTVASGVHSEIGFGLQPPPKMLGFITFFLYISYL